MEFKENGEIIYEGRIFRVIKDQVKTESGKETSREIVKHPGSAAIVPILNDGQVIMVEQYRYATGKCMLEIPAGTIEERETPKECAKRELPEETGYTSNNLSLLAKFYTAPGYSNEIISIYLATDLQKIHDEPEEEGISISIMEINEAIESISKDVMDSKSIIGLKLADQEMNT